MTTLCHITRHVCGENTLQQAGQALDCGRFIHLKTQYTMCTKTQYTLCTKASH